jgi:hypothetical protein
MERSAAEATVTRATRAATENFMVTFVVRCRTRMLDWLGRDDLRVGAARRVRFQRAEGEFGSGREEAREEETAPLYMALASSGSSVEQRRSGARSRGFKQIKLDVGTANQAPGSTVVSWVGWMSSPFARGLARTGQSIAAVTAMAMGHGEVPSMLCF